MCVQVEGGSLCWQDLLCRPTEITACNSWMEDINKRQPRKMKNSCIISSFSRCLFVDGSSTVLMKSTGRQRRKGCRSSMISFRICHSVQAHLPFTFICPREDLQQNVGIIHSPVDDRGGSALFSLSGSLSSSTACPAARSSSILLWVNCHRAGAIKHMLSSVDSRAACRCTAGGAAGGVRWGASSNHCAGATNTENSLFAISNSWVEKSGWMTWKQSRITFPLLNTLPLSALCISSPSRLSHSKAVPYFSFILMSNSLSKGFY